METRNGKNQSQATGAEALVSEAPYSVNFLARSPDGFEMQFTLRTIDQEGLLTRMQELTGQLLEAGFEPIARGYGRSESRAAIPRPVEPAKQETPLPLEPAPLFDDAWTGDEAEADKATAAHDSPSWCPIHNVEMRRYERNGEVWYSHKAQGERGEYWCKGRAAKTSR